MKGLALVIILILVGGSSACSDRSFSRTHDSTTRSVAENEPASPAKTVPKLTFIGPNDRSLTQMVVGPDSLYAIGSEIKFPDKNLFESRDGGRTWEESTSSLGEDSRPGFQHLQITNGALWALAGKLLLKRSGENTNWEVVGRLQSRESVLVSFRDEKLGYVVQVVETGCKILRTNDGGKVLRSVYENLVAGRPFDIALLPSGTVLLAMNNEYVLRGTDGGERWSQLRIVNDQDRTIQKDEWVSRDRGGASDLEVDQNGAVWVVGEKSSLFYSEDDGVHWRRPNKFPADRELTLNSIAFGTGDRAITVGDAGAVLYSTDKGQTWLPLQLDENPESGKDARLASKDNLLSVSFIGNEAVILGRDGVYRLSF